jgi:glycosyltransferase involved in cell wall biosynthesis
MDALLKKGIEVQYIDINLLKFSAKEFFITSFSNPIVFIFSLFVCVTSITTLSRFLSNIDCLVRIFSNKKKLAKYFSPNCEIRCHFIAKRAMFSLVCSKLFVCKYTLVAHAADIFSWDNSIYFKVKYAERVDCISNYNKGYLDAKFSFKFSTKLNLIRNSFYSDLKPFTLDSAAIVKPKKDKIYRFVYVGRLVKKKNLPVMIDILEEFSKVFFHSELIIIGEGGDDEANVDKKIKSIKSLVIKRLGYLDSLSIVNEMKKSDFTILLSTLATKKHRDQDGIPTIFLESLAAGTPVVTTQVSGIPELVNDLSNGIILEKQTASELHKKILLFNPDKQKIIEGFNYWYKSGNGSKYILEALNKS